MVILLNPPEQINYTIDPPADPVAPLPLSAKHLAELRASGLSDATIRASGIHTETDPRHIASLLNWQGSKPYDGKHGPAMVIPHHDSGGKRIGYSCLKFDRPRVSKKDGKPKKYEMPYGKPVRLYIPPMIVSDLDDVAKHLLITEGQKKALCAAQNGKACVSVQGVWNFSKPRKKDAGGNWIGERDLSSDFDGIVLDKRTIYICYDSDSINNPSVAKAEYALAELLIASGAEVRIVRLPPDGEVKVGLDDFVDKHGIDAFRKLMDEAKPPVKLILPIESPDDPHRLARHVKKALYRHDGETTLRRQREEYLAWSEIESRYISATAEDIRAAVTDCVKAELDRANVIAQQMPSDSEKKPPTATKVTTALISNVLHALTPMVLVPSNVESPSWIGDALFPPNEILPCRNGLVHLPSFVASKKNYIIPPTPRFFSQFALDYPFHPNAPKPETWLTFLAQVFGDDAESIRLLQEWCGYCLTQDTRQQKILALIGAKRGGKGTISRVLQSLIGKANCAGPTLASLATNFGLEPLLGRSLATIADGRLTERADTAVITERLLAISGEDGIDVPRKYKSAINNTKLPTRIMYLSNELPRLGETSGALAGRIMLLTMPKSFYGHEDPYLTDKIRRELPGVLLWAIAGWQRLNQRGRFQQPEASKEIIQELADLNSPVGGFVRQYCNIGNGEASCEILYDRWREYCKTNGIDDPQSKNIFARNLRAAAPGIRDKRIADNLNGRIRIYTGIELKPVPEKKSKTKGDDAGENL